MEEPTYAARWVNGDGNREDWGESLMTVFVFVGILAFPFLLYWLFGAP
jgi:hypothetical protein